MSNTGVIAVERALGLLDCFTLSCPKLTLTELALKADLHKTTAYRLLNSLERMNYVVRHVSGEYTLGPRVLYLGSVYSQSFQLEVLVKPILENLCEQTGESASYYVLSGNERLCQWRVERTEGVRDTVLPGTLLPLDESSIGKVLTTWGINKAEARPDILDLPAFSTGVRDKYLGSVCVPIFGNKDIFLGALAISGLSTRLKSANQKELKKNIFNAATLLSRQLGASTELCEKMYFFR